MKSSWGEEEVYVASGNHFGVVHGGGGGVFMCAGTPSLIQLQVSGLWAHELVAVLHDVHGCREEEG